MIIFFRQSIRDIWDNRFIHTVTVITISLSVFIGSGYALFYLNTLEVLENWRKGIKIMAYLKPLQNDSQIVEFKKELMKLYGVKNVNYISKEEAYEDLKKKMTRQASLFDNLSGNPLPDAFEIQLVSTYKKYEKVELLAEQIEAFVFVDEVEYGQSLIGRFTQIFNMFEISGIAIGILFFIATVFFIANTVRLVIYSRQEEVEIMRFVGAEDYFIKAPFYIEAVIQGAVGGMVGLILLYFSFIYISSEMSQNTYLNDLQIHFLSFQQSSITIGVSIFIGWLGCYLSLKKFLDV